MKTVDLIPFILWELSEGEKYGIELTKEIEAKTQNKIVIKQPSLYTILKKLEKSKFITSFWLDSEIGGKRHYYKLTENGKLQLSTLPNLKTLLKSLDSDLSSIDTKERVEDKTILDPTYNNYETTTAKNDHSILDIIDSQPSILPTEEVFANNNLNSKTEFEINKSNAEILKPEHISTANKFAENENVSEFIKSTEPVESTNIIFENKSKSFDNINLLDSIEQKQIISDLDNVKFYDYKDLKTDLKTKQIHGYIKISRLKSVITSSVLLLLAVLFWVIVKNTATTTFYICELISISIALFYPASIFCFTDKLITKYEKSIPKNNYKSRILIITGCILSIFILIIIGNISNQIKTVKDMFGVKNFFNLYAPIFLALTAYLDLLLLKIFETKLNEKI